MIKAVIFDMDGLLIDSEPFWRKSHQAVLAAMGYQVTEDEVRLVAGKRTSDQVALWQERFGFVEPPNNEITADIVDGVIRAIHEDGAPMAGVEQLVHELHAHGVPMAVASSSAMPLIKAVLDRLGLSGYMQAVHSGENEERGKPFPDVFLSTARTLGVAAADCLVFEDSLNGVRAAVTAGMKCIAVPEGPYDSAAFEAVKPERIIKSLEEVSWQDIDSL